MEGEPIYNIVGERVALGPMRRDLLPLYRVWINDFDAVKNLGVSPVPMTEESEVGWFEDAARNRDGVFFTIYERHTGEPIGNLSISLDHRNRAGRFGIMIGEESNRGKGFGTEATRLALDYAFTAQGLHNVMLSVYEFNAAGRRCYEKAGFREIGRRRECRLMGGRLWDEIFMDCLSTEFESPVLRKVFTTSSEDLRGLKPEV
jgi:RimJ/RimL family protein N-acetyltransferase